MNCRKIIKVVFASTFVIVAIVAVSRGQSTKSFTSPDFQKAVLARLAEIQSAAQALDPDKVFSFVLENDAEALAQNGKHPAVPRPPFVVFSAGSEFRELLSEWGRRPGVC